ncbi:hypothetical protein C8R44DRAFT_726036 [Mycena epipterygia]|nr:hypothetical protein C8R44DRAFT_726036 [Mycena epipterygia]
MTSEAETHMLKSEYAKARSIHAKMVSKIQDMFDYAFNLVNLTEIDIIIGASLQDVHENLDKARESFTATGALYGLNFCDFLSGELNLREGRTHTAKLIFQQCFNSDRQHDSQAVVVYLAYAKGKQNKRGLHKALQFLGDIFLTQGDLNTAGSLFTVALDTFTYMDIHHSRAECMLRLGDISEQRGRSLEAVEFWKEAQPPL